MPFNGAGTYVRPAGQPVVAGTDILDSTFNTYTADVATALTNCVTRDGQSPATSNLPMGGFKHTGLAAGTTAGDSVRYEQVADLAIAQTHAATSKATPVDADEFPISDSAASFGLKKLTWSNVKATLASTFAAIAGSASQNFATNTLTASGGVLSISASTLLGYGAGAGGTVTQTTSKITAVTLNKPTGKITMNNASLPSGVQITFTLNNSLISANDALVLGIDGSTMTTTHAAYRLQYTCIAGGAIITVTNIYGGALAEAVGLNFAVIKCVTA